MTDENKDEEVSVATDLVPVVTEKAELVEAELMLDEDEEETDADPVLVDEAVNKIKNLCGEANLHHRKTMLDIGEYLIRKFYNNDHNNVKNRKKAIKDKSLNIVIKKLKMKGEDSPSKSWLYTTIKLVVDDKALGGVQSYGLLPMSSKVLLLPLKNETLKKELAEEAFNKKFSVSELRQRIKERTDPKDSGLLRSLKNATYVTNHTGDAILTDFNLSELSADDLAKAKATVKAQIKKLDDIIKNKTFMLEKYREITKSINAVPKKSKPKT